MLASSAEINDHADHVISDDKNDGSWLTVLPTTATGTNNPSTQARTSHHVCSPHAVTLRGPDEKVKVCDFLSKTLHLCQTPVFSLTFFDIFESLIAKTYVFIHFFEFFDF